MFTRYKITGDSRERAKMKMGNQSQASEVPENFDSVPEENRLSNKLRLRSQFQTVKNVTKLELQVWFLL